MADLVYEPGPFGRPRLHGVGSEMSIRGCVCRWCAPDRYGSAFADGKHMEQVVEAPTGSWWDTAPQTEADVERIRKTVYGQLRELQSQGLSLASPNVTCPCGLISPLILACRSHHCGLWICRRCADQHFGPAPESPVISASWPDGSDS